MKLDGRRESTNVDDRRSGSTIGKVGGFGIGGLALIALITMLMGGNPMDVINSGIVGQGQQSSETYQPTAEEEQLATFCRQILAGTEDVWTRVFDQQLGRTYTPPTLVLFTDAVQSGCGGATKQTGPFYCSADQCLYIDLSFLSTMRQSMGAGGDFAYAYVIAHEVGHHVQHLLGILDQAHSKMSRMSETQSNQMSVKLELQADFLAGVWGYYDNKFFGSLEEGDIEEAIQCASVIGDDYLQKKSYGYEQPESFNHGRSEWRMRWLAKGLATGDLSQGDTFSVPYDQL